MEIDGQFLEACADAPRFLHPPGALLNNGTWPIGRSVDAPKTTVDGAASVQLYLQDLVGLGKDALAPPLREVVVHGPPGTEPLG